MKTTRFYPGIFCLFFCLLSQLCSYSQGPDKSFSGTYTLDSDGVKVTLVLKQDAIQQVSGTLTSTTGISYQLQGDVVEDAAMGICSGKDGSVYFEIYKIENELILSLIEPDGNNMPDYNTATYLSLTKSSANQLVEWNAGSEAAVEIVHQDQLGNNQSQIKNKPMNTNSGNQPLTGQEVGDPSWGFKFIPPSGWVYQQATDGWILGHNTIPGMIIIFPHMLQNMDEVQQEMFKGIEEEGSNLQLSGNLTTQANNILTGDYKGIMDGQQVKAKGFGTLSPYGGGAFIIAVSTPDKLAEDIIRDAGRIASNLVYSKAEVTDLMGHFAGKWASFSTNTSSWIRLYPDGTYDEQYESSYSGDLSGGGNWGAYGNDQAKGRWTILGNRDAGKIVVRLSNGNEIIYEYRVHEERGEKYYSEYWFNGKLYSKSRD